MSWFIKNIAPETFHKDLRGAFVPNERPKPGTPESKNSKITPEFLEANALEIHEGETDWGLETAYRFKGQYYVVKRPRFLDGEKLPLSEEYYSEEARRGERHRVVKCDEDRMFLELIEQSFTGRMKRMFMERLTR